MSSNYWVTTADNECNPFTDFTEWWKRDRELGHHTCEWVDHYVKTSIDFDEDEIEEDVDFGVSLFLELNPSGLHYKVYEDEADTLIPLMNEVYNSEIKDKLDA